jgi:hypothetical protein
MDLLQELVYTPKELDETVYRAESKLKRKNIKHFIMAPLTTSVASFILFIILVNVYSPFAYACGRIPYLGELAKFVALSPSLSAAVENEYVQPVELEQIQEGITARVEYVIVDQKQLNIFYTLDSTLYEKLGANTQIKKLDGSELEGYGQSEKPYENSNKELRKVVIDFIEEDMPSSMQFCIKVLDASWTVEPVPVSEVDPLEGLKDKEPNCLTEFTFELEFNPYYTSQGESLEINHIFEIDGQKLTLTTAEIYPTHTQINFQDDQNNTAWLQSLEFYIENEKKQKYERISDGLTAIGGGSDSPMMASHRIESTFFSESKKLTLYITGVTWLDKNMETIEIDLKNKSVEVLPQGVVLEEANSIGSSWELVFTGEEIKEGSKYQMFGTTYYDKRGKEYSYNMWTTTNIESNIEQVGETMQKEVSQFKTTFVLKDYLFDTVYLSPTYSRRVELPVPIKITIKE